VTESTMSQHLKKWKDCPKLVEFGWRQATVRFQYFCNIFYFIDIKLNFVYVQVDNKEIFTFSDTVFHAYTWMDNKWKEVDKRFVRCYETFMLTNAVCW